MRLAELMQRSTVRLAALFMVLVIAAQLLAGGVGFGLMHAKLSDRQDARVIEVFDGLVPSIEVENQVELLALIAARIAATPDKSSIYVLEDENGTALVANVKEVALSNGWSTLPAGTLGLGTDYSYRVFRGAVGTYTLTVGLSDADVDDLGDIIGVALAWSALIVVALTLILGSVLALRMQHRMTMFDATMHRVSQGDLTARLAVTDRRDDLDRIAATINTTLTRLESNVIAMRQVSSDIAHDLRTPLNRLRIRLEQASEQAELGQPVTAALSAALLAAIEDGDRINATFAALLRISQIEAGARAAGFQATDLRDVLDNVVSVYCDVAEDAGMTLLPFAASEAVIHGDADLLTQMFANLIENALRHCPTGATIKVSLDASAGRATVTVADTGPGIPADERDKVLQRLYRMDQSRTTPGSGLGLSLVKAISDLHHAKLTLMDTRSEAPQGLTVQVSFPQATLPIA